MDASAYLRAIQSLKGETPGEKYKELHSTAATMVRSGGEQAEQFVKTGKTDVVPEALRPILRVLVGLKLKSKDAVVEALKSDDVTVVKVALRGKWFFGDASNDLLNARYFLDKVLPFASLRTRLELIKVLSKCLQARRAESFHKEFAAHFGRDQALPLLLGCGEDYVYDEVMKNDIRLPDRMLKQLYRKYPQLTVRLLRAIKDGKARNWINNCATTFLPCLVKNHTQEFIEFSRSLRFDCYRERMGSTRAKHFLRNATDALVKSPRDFLDWLPLRLVKSKLSKQQYEAMLQNLLHADARHLNAWEIIDRVKTYYPKDGGFELFRAHYEKALGKDLLQHEDLLDDDAVYALLPDQIRAECSRAFVNRFVADKAKYLKRVYMLPPSEAIPLLKEQIKKSPVLTREQCLTGMLRSCHLHKSKADLLPVLRYYNSRHKNEQAPVLHRWLGCLVGLFDNMESLDGEHWQVIKDIVQRAYVKGDLFLPNCFFDVQSLFRPMLSYFLRQCNADEADNGDKVFLDKIVNMILEYYCEHGHRWDFIVTGAPDIAEACLEKFLLAVPQKYPESHAVWKSKRDKKLHLTTYFVEQMGEFNEKNLRAPPDPRLKATKLLIQHYPWLAKFATELLVDEENAYNSTFKRSLRRYCPEFYQNVIDEHPHMINHVRTNDAWTLLKRDRSKISSKINEYATACRQKLLTGGRQARRFVMSLKWYQDIPLKFVEKCMAEVEEKGSILILGILLDGNALSTFVEPYLPKDTELEIDSDNAKKDYELVTSLPRALNYANPPPPLQALIPLCRGDYLSAALQTLSSIARRVPIDAVLSFASHLTNNAVSMKKAGIRLVFQVAPKPQVREFLTKICKQETNPGIREVIAKMVYEVFTQTPSREDWQLMKEFIHGLLPDDKKIYGVLKNLQSVHVDYAADYILEIFKKINSFSDEELSEKERSELILSFLDEIEDSRAFNKLPENVTNEIVTNYLFRCTLKFIFDIYLLSDEQKFENRLKVFVGILSENLMQIYKPHPKHPRYYPVLKGIHERLADGNVLDHLMRSPSNEMSRRLVMSVLEITAVRKDLEYFINFNIYQILFDASDAKSFGEKCGKNIDDLIKLYSNQLVIEYYGKCLERIVDRTSFMNDQFDIIDGLMSHKFSYGVFIGLKLLSRWKVYDYDEKYDKFVEAAKNSDDLMVQVLLNDFLCGIFHPD